MIMRLFVTIISMMFFATSVQAALLTNIAGAVSVNTGNGFKRVSVPTQLKPGDRVMAGTNGKAEISYNALCFAPVNPNQVVIVRADEPCTPPSATDAAPAATTGLPTTTLLVGGLVVAAGAGIAIAASNGGSNNNGPASP